jgi:CheY-like chemotaxis protein/HD-like signal output (HDOD) protein
METNARIEENAGRVLVIDDDENIRKTVERHLHRLGYEVLDAPDGERGLTLAMSKRPDVILVDLRMPGIDGHTFLRRLSATNLSAAVVVMSGQGYMDDVIEVLRAGAVDYLRKPWSGAGLAAAVARAMDAHTDKQLRANHKPPSPIRPTPISVPVVEVNRLPPIRRTPISMPALAADPFHQLLARVRSGEVSPPAVASVVASLRALVQSPEPSAEAVTVLLEQDQTLAADVLRLANTAAYAREGRSTSIRAAVSRLGCRQIHGLVETMFLRRPFTVRDLEVHAIVDRLWRRSLAHALAMRGLAEAANQAGLEPRVNPDTAYLVGLLADCGASLLLWLLDERHAAGELGGEMERFLPCVRQHHQEIGAALVGRWLGDPDIESAVKEHHPDGTPPVTPLGRMMVVAHAMAQDFGAGEDPTAVGSPSRAMADLCASELRLTNATIAAVTEAALDGYIELVHAMG